MPMIHLGYRGSREGESPGVRRTDIPLVGLLAAYRRRFRLPSRSAVTYDATTLRPQPARRRSTPMRRRLAVLTATVTALLLPTSPVAALGTLDQQQTSEEDNAHFIYATVEAAQIFTAGITGQLDHVDLLLNTGPDLGGSGTPDSDLTVEIWTTAGGLPASPVPGATGTVLAANIPKGQPTWAQVAISAPSVAGTQYAIVLSSPGSSVEGCQGDPPDPGQDCWQWFFDADGNPYTGGALYSSLDSGATWAAVGGSDAAFRTYVTPPAPSVAASLADAAMPLPSPTSPLATLGFGLLLVGALGGLALINVRSRSR